MVKMAWDREDSMFMRVYPSNNSKMYLFFYFAFLVLSTFKTRPPKWWWTSWGPWWRYLARGFRAFQAWISSWSWADPWVPHYTIRWRSTTLGTIFLGMTWPWARSPWSTGEWHHGPLRTWDCPSWCGFCPNPSGHKQKSSHYNPELRHPLTSYPQTDISVPDYSQHQKHHQTRKSYSFFYRHWHP